VHQNQKMYEKLPFYLFCAIAQWFVLLIITRFDVMGHIHLLCREDLLKFCVKTHRITISVSLIMRAVERTQLLVTGNSPESSATHAMSSLTDTVTKTTWRTAVNRVDGIETSIDTVWHFWK
jgi:hypothetical protein